MVLVDIAYMESCTEVIPHEVLQTVMCSGKLQEEGTVNWISALSGDPATLESDMSDGGKPSVPQLDVQQAQTADPVINRVRELIQCDFCLRGVLLATSTGRWLQGSNRFLCRIRAPPGPVSGLTS